MQARKVKLKLLESEVQRQEYSEAPVKLEMIINKIDESNEQETVEPAIKLENNDKNQYDNEWWSHRERVAGLEKQIGQAF